MRQSVTFWAISFEGMCPEMIATAEATCPATTRQATREATLLQHRDEEEDDDEGKGDEDEHGSWSVRNASASFFPCSKSRSCM